MLGAPAGAASELASGVALASESLASGAARERLAKLVEATNREAA